MNKPIKPAEKAPYTVDRRPWEIRARKAVLGIRPKPPQPIQNHYSL